MFSAILFMLNIPCDVLYDMEAKFKTMVSER